MYNSTANKLAKQASAVLEANWRSDHTIPQAQLYPHQWLWDSCFHAIGLACTKPERATEELRSLIRGQWNTGMIPHMIFDGKNLAYDLWQSNSCQHAPANIHTSTITQPPILAIAVAKVLEKLAPVRKKAFATEMLGPLIRYHQWMYAARNPQNDGLIALIHPWENGLDNTPPWSTQIMGTDEAWWLKAAKSMGISKVVSTLRADTQEIPTEQRVDLTEGIKSFSLAREIRTRACGMQTDYQNLPILIASVTFNSVLTASNSALVQIAKIAGESVDPTLLANAEKTEIALDQLYDKDSGQYFPYDFKSKKQIKISTISTFLPLLSESISADHAERLVRLLNERSSYAPRYPVPSVPINSRFFSPQRYWQGPTWVNMNWLICEGLKRHGFSREAKKIRESSLDLVRKSGFREYFSPISAKGFGANDFSWTAALILDFLNQ